MRENLGSQGSQYARTPYFENFIIFSKKLLPRKLLQLERKGQSLKYYNIYIYINITYIVYIYIYIYIYTHIYRGYSMGGCDICHE